MNFESPKPEQPKKSEDDFKEHKDMINKKCSYDSNLILFAVSLY